MPSQTPPLRALNFGDIEKGNELTIGQLCSFNRGKMTVTLKPGDRIKIGEVTDSRGAHFFNKERGVFEESDEYGCYVYFVNRDRARTILSIDQIYGIVVEDNIG